MSKPKSGSNPGKNRNKTTKEAKQNIAGKQAEPGKQEKPVKQTEPVKQAEPVKPDAAGKTPEPVREEAPRPRTIAGQLVEVEPKKKEEDDSYREDNLEMKTMSFRERRAVRKARREKEMEISI